MPLPPPSSRAAAAPPLMSGRPTRLAITKLDPGSSDGPEGRGILVIGTDCGSLHAVDLRMVSGSGSGSGFKSRSSPSFSSANANANANASNSPLSPSSPGPSSSFSTSRWWGATPLLWSLNRIHSGGVSAMDSWARMAGQFGSGSGFGSGLEIPSNHNDGDDDDDDDDGGRGANRSFNQEYSHWLTVSRCISHSNPSYYYHPGQKNTLTAATLPSSPTSPHFSLLSSCVAVGGRDGSVSVIESGSGEVVSYQSLVHWKTGRSGFSGLLASAAGTLAGFSGVQSPVEWSPRRRPIPANANGAAVNSLVCIPEGLISSGSDGVVRFMALTR
eukprot:CAMPEP_0175068796 /NCGR_PEP_ID=MMETSP0052_2-20121109/17861_1 /TAXON_ID=51329 ORGANISM="Polytomella parva, Strain SAG 63-3" /NCGR_SAMPLE_ID=MMETSP0052_2 /ASSEMBLY_ACC=CAM_ASM_000194 /LENGTH=328 /DNA_ID=CAMNT_0016335845 /DNA_START=79 /DNA_END=1065 /DNA_ORIENTATION=-